MMEEPKHDADDRKGWKRPPFVGLLACLTGILVGLLIPLGKALRKAGKTEKPRKNHGKTAETRGKTYGGRCRARTCDLLRVRQAL